MGPTHQNRVFFFIRSYPTCFSFLPIRQSIQIRRNKKDKECQPNINLTFPSNPVQRSCKQYKCNKTDALTATTARQGLTHSSVPARPKQYVHNDKRSDKDSIFGLPTIVGDLVSKREIANMDPDTAPERYTRQICICWFLSMTVLQNLKSRLFLNRSYFKCTTLTTPISV